jgi:hypothetical protein
MVVHACGLSKSGIRGRRIKVQSKPWQSERAEGVAQVVEHLPSKCKALYPIFSTKKKTAYENPVNLRLTVINELTSS